NRSSRRDPADRAERADRAGAVGVATRRPDVLLDEGLAPLGQRGLVGLAEHGLDGAGGFADKELGGDREVAEERCRGGWVPGTRLYDGLRPAGQVDLDAAGHPDVDARSRASPDLAAGRPRDLLSEPVALVGARGGEP